MSKLGAEAKRAAREAEATKPVTAIGPLVTVYAVVRQRHADGRVGGVQLVEAEIPESAIAHGQRTAPSGAWEALALLTSKLEALFLRGGP